MGDTITYLPDGQLIFPPEDPYTWSEGEYVHPAKLTHDVGQAGLFYAQRPFFQGLGTTATVCLPGSTQIGLQTEMIDTHQGHSTSTSNTLYYFPQTRNGGYPAADYYLCIGYVPVSTTDAADSFGAQLSSSVSGNSRGMFVPSGPSHNIDLMVVDILAATGSGSGGPNVSLQLKQSSAGNVNTVTSGKCSSLTVRWIGGSRTFNTASPVTSPHSWIPQDEASASATGASSQPGGVKVPLNREIVPNLQFYNSPPICRLNVTASTTQTIPSSSTAWTAVQFLSADIDNFSGWSSGTNTRYTVQRSGLYLVAGCANWVESTGTHSGYRACRLQVNGDATKIYGGNTMLPTTGTAADSLNINAVALMQLNAGDYVEFQMQQTQSNSPTALSMLGGNMIAVWQSL